MPAVLIIEDEPAIADALIYALKTENFSVTHVTTAQEGLDHFNSHAPDFAVLDIGLPDFTGFDLCRKIRDFSQVPSPSPPAPSSPASGPSSDEE
jgi:two-component system catabolic regulation response regulator CreB